MPPRGGAREEEDVSGGLRQQRRHFSPFVSSVEGLLGVEATATLKRIASRLATKWKQSYSKTCGYVIRDGVADLSGKAFTPSHVRDDPLV